MKKQLLVFGLMITAVLVTISCQKKNDSDAIAPTYGSTGNPYPNNQTVTGSTSFTNPATQNSSIDVGNSVGWTNPTCLTTGSITLRAFKGSTEVVLTFAQPALTNTYSIGTPQGTVSCGIQINNAPNQPAGISWLGKSGNVIVQVSASNITAVLNNVVCTQSNFNFPTVLATGFVACGSQQ
ncbi:MAG: hypothetical protein JNL60_07865 [Bacteroidia bacterium]|nr:hypothetical protein [Bacteroidia bacterium]